MKKILTIFLISFIFIVVSFAFVACKQQKDSVPPTKDTLVVKGLNEHNEFIDDNGDTNDIVFTKISKVNILSDETFSSNTSYFVLEGMIKTPAYAFNLDNINLEFCIGNEAIFFILIDKDYSCALSDISLFFNEENGEMNGEFKLVFVLDGENESKYNSVGTDEFETSQFYLHLYSWGKDKADFKFYFSEIELVDKY